MTTRLSFLQRILEDKRQEVVQAKVRLPVAELRRRIAGREPPLDFAGALRGSGMHLIAEVKKASPSRGLLVSDFDPVRLAGAYKEGGAAAISVLTDSPYFQGSLQYLAQIKDALGEGCPPLLRKDFILDPYQLYEARASGADAVLLIVAALNDGTADASRITTLLRETRDLGMEALVEVHTQEELEQALKCGTRVLGINNRDLHTFQTSLEVTRRLRPLVKGECLVVSESGIESQEDIGGLERLGVNAVLIGEALVTASDPKAKIRELLRVK